jgi:hypothetical protein
LPHGNTFFEMIKKRACQQMADPFLSWFLALAQYRHLP